MNTAEVDGVANKVLFPFVPKLYRLFWFFKIYIFMYLDKYRVYLSWSVAKTKAKMNIYFNFDIDLLSHASIFEIQLLASCLV